jgi:arylesterase/paraoxonase
MRRVLVAFAILLLVGAVWLLRTFWIGGYWRDLSPRFAGTCTPIEGMPGPEDLTIHPRTGIAYVSSADRRALAAGDEPRGAIFALDLSAEKPVPKNLTPDAPPDSHFHGISLWVGDGGPDLLFVVNHPGDRHTIEVYEVGAERLVHRRTLSDPLLRSPNDLVALGPERLYVSNDHGWRDGLPRTVEEWFRIPVSDVVTWDGRGFRVAATGIKLANGIHASADGRSVYVASPTGREIRVYARDEASGALALQQRVALGTAPDNIEVASDGSLWVGAHPNLFALVAHMRRGGRAHAPAQVVRAAPQPDGSFRVEEVFMDPGQRMCASSVAAVQGDRLLIGGILEPWVLDCRMP